MRTVLFRTFLTFTLLAAPFCRADLLLYRGVLRMDHLGDGGEAKQSYRAWILLDRETGNMAKIDYYSAAGFKFYTVEEYQGFQFTSVAGAHGITNSLITKAATSLDESNQLLVTSIFLQGPNKHLTVKRGGTLSFPGTLSWASRGVAPSTRSGLPEAWAESGAVSFSASETTTSNNHAETLAQAEARLIADFQTKGYREYQGR
jgi:hypothetical protein